MTTCTVSPLLAANVGTGCGENAYLCYQCKRCSSGCPVARYADMHPAMIMRAVQLGQLDMVFDDRFIWLCTGCETCSTRCPQGIDIAAIMDELKIIARRDGRIPAGTPSAAMLKLNYDSFVRWGRMWEVELIARDVLVVQTGCSAIASAKAGLLRPEAALEHAGPGLQPPPRLGVG